MPRENFKSIVSFLIATIIITIYGGQVCPFIEQLTLIQLSVILVCAFTVGFFLRKVIFKYCFKRLKIASAVEIYPSLWHYLLVDIAVWIVTGFSVAIWNMVAYQFPLLSGLKIVFACATIGFFSATYFALTYERIAITALSELPGSIEYTPKKFFSISKKFLIFLGISYLVIAAIILLLILKDLSYISDNIHLSPPIVFRSVAIEVLFVFGVIFGGSMLIAREYGQNLTLMFQLQLNALNEVSNGNYNTHVPVVSNDEFGLIANHSNQMIGGLREKERIRNIFGKYLSPSIAHAILENEEGTELGGRLTEVAILFADLRNYTTLSEKLHPRETLKFLNSYFTLLVDAIYESNGVVDKFIGDAVMAIYGLDNPENPCELAVKTASHMVVNLENFNLELQKQGMPSLSMGIGIHFGTVIAGNIGSKERLEYTVIGDAVNTASRLEQITKVVLSKIIISKDVFERIPRNMQSNATSLGEFELKGKSEKVHVYGIF